MKLISKDQKWIGKRIKYTLYRTNFYLIVNNEAFDILLTHNQISGRYKLYINGELCINKRTILDCGMVFTINDKRLKLNPNDKLQVRVYRFSSHLKFDYDIYFNGNKLKTQI